LWFASRFAAAQEPAVGAPPASVPAAVAARQDPPAEKAGPRLAVRRSADQIVLAADERPIPVTEFVRRWHETTGRSFVLGRLDGAPIALVGEVSAKSSDADFLFESILSRSGYVLVAAGPPEAKLYGVESLEQARSLRQNAPVVSAAEAPELVRRPAQVFTAVFAVSGPAEAYRVAFSQLFTQRHCEAVVDLTATGGLVVSGLGPTVAAAAKIVAETDRAAPTIVEVVPLAHAVATEAAALLESAFRPARESAPMVVAANGAVTPAEESTWRVVADARTNSVVLKGVETRVAAASKLLRALDRPVGK
jgi:general secretion pathway protein D